MMHYRCRDCGAEYDFSQIRYLCTQCGAQWQPGAPLRGVLEVRYDYAALGHNFDATHPDWSNWLPVEQQWFPSFPVGNTPYFKAENLSSTHDVWIKNDGLNPSGSLKDRASIVMVAEARKRGLQQIVCASTGNAASALAACCAAAGLQAVIFVPASAPIAKRVQMKICGAQVIEVDGDYDDAFAASIDYSRTHGTLNRNTAYHPFTIEGKKSAALEIFAQNGMKIPDYLVVPMGDGVIISGIFKGFWDLQQAGLIQHLPHLIGVQARGSNAIARYLESGHYANVQHPDTIADSISVKAPSNCYMAADAIKLSNGWTQVVDDDAILSAQRLLARQTGIFAEPAAAASMAGYLASQQRIPQGKQVVLLITGHGLKDVAAAARGLL